MMRGLLHVAGWSYDADGNLLNDGRNNYAYDAEGRIVSLNGQPTYLYDAEGRRVAKYSGSTITAFYLLGLGGEQVTELNSAGTWMHSNVWAPGGRLLATYEGPGESKPNTWHFHLTDWLGTNRMQTNASGNSEEVCYSYPFGDGLTCTGTDATEHHFTGKERDTESGLDYFYARYYSSDLARFMSPDWAAAPTAVPYATFGDPQTLNLYAYVNNNPNTGLDLDGHVEENRGDPNEAFSEMNADIVGYEMQNGGPGGIYSTGSGPNSTRPSGATSESTGASGSGTPGTPPLPKPSNPYPADPPKKQSQDGQNATSNDPVNESENAKFNACVADATKSRLRKFQTQSRGINPPLRISRHTLSKQP
jgi:RHS repeat-associated protein